MANFCQGDKKSSREQLILLTYSKPASVWTHYARTANALKTNKCAYHSVNVSQNVKMNLENIFLNLMKQFLFGLLWHFVITRDVLRAPGTSKMEPSLTFKSSFLDFSGVQDTPLDTSVKCFWQVSLNVSATTRTFSFSTHAKFHGQLKRLSPWYAKCVRTRG